MHEFDIDEILLEGSYKSKRGYIDLKSIEDIQLLENTMYEMGYSPKLITEYTDELMYENMKRQIYVLNPADLNEGIIYDILRFVSKSWQKLKSYISDLFNNASKELEDDYTFDKSVSVTIPSELSEQIIMSLNLISEVKSKSDDAKKGYYNEALVCNYISEHKDKKLVNIDDDLFKPHKKEIDTAIKKYQTELSPEVKKEVDVGSRGMSNYILNSMADKGLVIVNIWMSGSSKQMVDKKDISIKFKKGLSKKEVDHIINYSLKLYSGREVGISNSTAVKMIMILTSPNGVTKGKASGPYVEWFEQEVEEKKRTDKKYKEHEDELEKLNTDKENRKEELRALYGKGTLAYKNADANDEKLKKIRGAITVHRNPLNSLYAGISFNILSTFIKKKENKEMLVRNLMQLLGLDAKDTKILMVIMKKAESGKNKIIDALLDEHPEFKLNDINLTKPDNIAIKINNGQELIVKLSYKEGEKKHAQASVSFKNVKSREPDVWQSVK